MLSHRSVIFGVQPLEQLYLVKFKLAQEETVGFCSYTEAVVYSK